MSTPTNVLVVMQPSPVLTVRVRNVLTNLFDMALDKMGNDPAGLMLRSQRRKVFRMISELDDSTACDMANALRHVASHISGPMPAGEPSNVIAMNGKHDKT